MGWLSRLFGEPKEELQTLSIYKVEPKKRKVATKLSLEQKKNLVIDRNINGMKYKDLADKYGVSVSGARRIVVHGRELYDNAARRV